MSDISLNITENNSQVVVNETENTEVSIITPSTAGEISFTPVGSLSSTNMQDALSELSHLEYSQDTAPTGTIPEGALWYDTNDEQFYARVNDEWKEIVIEQYSGNIDGGNYS